jgi:broad specificity phosphatase PhoE
VLPLADGHRRRNRKAPSSGTDADLSAIGRKQAQALALGLQPLEPQVSVIT